MLNPNLVVKIMVVLQALPPFLVNASIEQCYLIVVPKEPNLLVQPSRGHDSCLLFGGVTLIARCVLVGALLFTNQWTSIMLF